MEITSTAVPSTIPLNEAGKAGANAELVDATQKFEAVFLRQFLGDALKPILHATPGSQGPGSGFYQYMMTDVIASSLTSQEQFGMASLLQMQLGEQAASRVPELDEGVTGTDNQETRK